MKRKPANTRLPAVRLLLENPWERTESKLVGDRDSERDVRAAMLQAASRDVTKQRR